MAAPGNQPSVSLVYNVRAQFNRATGTVTCHQGGKRLDLRPQKPLWLFRDEEVGVRGGGQDFSKNYLTPTRYTVTTRMILH